MQPGHRGAPRSSSRPTPPARTSKRTVAHVATQNGRRIKLRHLGVEANNAWLLTRAAALNLRTLLKHGLTRRDGDWALA